jgi:leucyl/phenylalanyl-tRNA---protein transferase
MPRITWLAPDDARFSFPPVEQALRDPPGLLAAGGGLETGRLIAAYRRGIFPWYSSGQPVLWWCPDPRAVLFPAEFRRSRSLAKSERNRGFEIRFDAAFAQVIDACAGARQGVNSTWITPEMRAAYIALHEVGVAHSVECWLESRLVGGLYGVQLGRVFFGESMFSHVSDASKVALSGLVRLALAAGTRIIDCQLASRHLQTLGSRNISRRDFSALLAEHAAEGVSDAWSAAVSQPTRV